MHTNLSGVLAVVAVACSAPESNPGGARDVVGKSEQPVCAGLYAANAVTRTGTVCYVSPDTLAAATDGWGPQALALSVDRGFAPQITYDKTPSISKAKNSTITKSLQETLGFSVTSSVNLVAATTVLVPTGAYYRIEAYPEYQLTTWELRADACSFLPDTLISTGYVYRPTGVHFRVLVFVSGAWNALVPPTAAELTQPPPWSRGAAGEGGTPSDAGAGDSGTQGG